MDVEEEQKTPDIKRVLIIGTIVLAIIVMISSYVTADALGARLERRITAGHAELEKLVQDDASQVSALVLGTEPLSEELVSLVRTYFVEPPEAGHERDLFDWMEEYNVSMSDLRHEKVLQLINTGRKRYQERRGDLRAAEHNYLQSLNSPYTGFWLKRNGYPKIDL